MSHLCIKPACGPTCCGCNHAISEQTARDYAIRYAWLRLPSSRVPISSEAAHDADVYDAAIDAAMPAKPCAGANCGATTGPHSAECIAEHARAVAGLPKEG